LNLAKARCCVFLNKFCISMGNQMVTSEIRK